MLIEFSVTNFRSIKEKQTLTMAASKYFKEMEKENCFESGLEGLPKLLRSAAIYGPNASGKSNLLAALSFMQNMVLSSAKDIQEGEALGISPFQLDRASKDKESEFEINFIEGSVRYQYGFALNKNRILREWLIAYPGRRPQRWFDREHNGETGEDIYEFGPKFLGGRLRQDWRKTTRSNALFLSVAVQFNNEQLRPVFNWFQKRLLIISPRIPLDIGYTATACESEEAKIKVLNFMNAADLSIADIRIIKKMFSPEDLPQDLPTGLREHLHKELDGKEVKDLKIMHKNTETDELVPFGLNDESDGTKSLFSFAGPWLDVITNNKVLFVDEIDSSLHPLVVHQLVRFLHHAGGTAQLVFTTHDSTILGQDILRRDQVWFIEKDKSNASKLFSLSDFKVRENEAIERGYLRGRYGAIPYIEEFLNK